LDELAIDLGLANAVIQKNLGLKDEILNELSKLEASAPEVSKTPAAREDAASQQRGLHRDRAEYLRYRIDAQY